MSVRTRTLAQICGEPLNQRKLIPLAPRWPFSEACTDSSWKSIQNDYQLLWSCDSRDGTSSGLRTNWVTPCLQFQVIWWQAWVSCPDKGGSHETFANIETGRKFRIDFRRTTSKILQLKIDLEYWEEQSEHLWEQRLPDEGAIQLPFIHLVLSVSVF